MAKSYTVYCRGRHCLLRSNCKRYLNGQRMPDSMLESSDQHCWIDKCDEESRDMFDPERKSS
jgi:hypothetical protein